MAQPEAYRDLTIVPRIAVPLPLPLPAPDGFDPERLETWPAVVGRLEYVRGRLYYMPPSGDIQQRVAVDVVHVLARWVSEHPEFIAGANEAGVLLEGEVRAADAAIWERVKLGTPTGGLPRVAPELAVEIQGKDDAVSLLAEKADWYLRHGTKTVWLVMPASRRVTVVTAAGSSEYGVSANLPAPAGLPGLEPAVADFYRQLAR